MNLLRKHTRDLREGSLYSLSHQHLVILTSRLISSLGVLLSANRKSNSITFKSGIFCRVIRIAAVHKHFTACWQLYRRHIQSSHITGPAWHKCKLYWQSGFGRDDMHFHSVEVAAFCGALATKLFASRQPTSLYADVVTYSDGEAIEQVLSRSIGLLEDPSELVKDADGQFFNFMQYNRICG